MVLLWICLILANVLSQQLKQDYQLRFSQQDTFKIVQFTDTHFGENDSKDIKSQKVLRDIIRWEKPDLVVVTGDVVSDYAWDKKTRPWMAQRYDRFAKIMEEENVWWATAMGNHDFGTDLTMHEVLHLDMSYPHSLTQQNSHKLSRDFTYMLPVYDSKGSSI